MFGGKLLFGICLLAWTHQTLAVYSMIDTCKYYGEGYIADPFNCQGWGYCRNGQLIQTGNCNKGYNYDSLKGICNVESQVICRNNVDVVCANALNNTFVSNPSDCSGYCYCTDGLAQCSKCPTGQEYDARKVACVWAEENTCALDSICRLIPNNKFVSDPLKCGSYIRCLDGAGISGTCGTGLYFSPTVGGCTDNNDYCTGKTIEDISWPPRSNNTICKNNYKSTGSANQFFADGLTCYGYYVCSSASSTGLWGKCERGTHFSANCVTPYTYACAEDRCGNLNLDFVAELGCKTYSICKDGKTSSKGHSCAAINPDFPYFDEYSGGCVKTKPAYTICSA